MTTKDKTMNTAPVSSAPVSSAAVMEALETLKAKYPHERIAVWAEYYPYGDYNLKEPHYRFVAIVGESGENAEYSHSTSLEKAISHLIELVGDRQPHHALTAKIAKHKAELEKLEAELIAKQIAKEVA